MNFNKGEIIGKVENVNTAVVMVKAKDESILSNIQVNQFVILTSCKENTFLIGMINKILKTNIPSISEEEGNFLISNIIKVVIVGTYIYNGLDSIFKRNIEIVPNINSECYNLTGEHLSDFMASVSKQSLNNEISLSLGKYTLSSDTEAIINGNNFFQRHAVIVGSTGSGKSWTVAKLIQQISNLKGANAIVIDIHGEYSTLKKSGINHYKIAGPIDKPKDNVIFLPYWFLSYEEMLTLVLQQRESTAQNQAAVFNDLVLKCKNKFLNDNQLYDYLEGLNVETPVPYSLEDLIQELNYLDTEMVPGARGEKAGPFNGKLTKVIERINARKNNKRFNFMFGSHEDTIKIDYLNEIAEKLMLPSSMNDQGGIKIIDFSEVPSDILPLAVSLITRIIFNIQQWIDKERRHPIALFCDEAHLYMSSETDDSIGKMSLNNFHRIAKEGRKYGISLITITQRPSEVSKTILSQSNNYIAMRLTNNEDQNVVKRLIPDNMGNLLDQLPILDTGECIVIGDASLLPTKIKIDPPEIKPNSATIDFWSEWSKEVKDNEITKAIYSLRRQDKF